MCRSGPRLVSARHAANVSRRLKLPTGWSHGRAAMSPAHQSHRQLPMHTGALQIAASPVFAGIAPVLKCVSREYLKSPCSDSRRLPHGGTSRNRWVCVREAFAFSEPRCLCFALGSRKSSTAAIHRSAVQSSPLPQREATPVASPALPFLPHASPVLSVTRYAPLYVSRSHGDRLPPFSAFLPPFTVPPAYTKPRDQLLLLTPPRRLENTPTLPGSAA
jgi:hypothetical protein